MRCTWLVLLTLAVSQSVTVLPTASGVDNSKTVYTTKSGKKYHLATCQFVKDKEGIESKTMKQAQEEGLTPCKKCKPGGKVPISKRNASKTSVQCKGVTLKRERCKRRTKKGEYCPDHRPKEKDAGKKDNDR